MKFSTYFLALIFASASIFSSGCASPKQNQPDLLPKQSAGNYGGQLGGAVLGEIARDAGTGNRVLDRVFIGVASEVGRNAGRRAAEAPYGDSQAQQQARGQQRAYVPMAMRDVDQMDTLALRTAFSYERLHSSLGGRTVSSALYREIAAPFETDLANFKAAYRMMEREGKDMRPWDPMLRAVSARIGSVSMAHLQTEGSVMLGRLQRPGGPGFVEVPQAQSLDALRRQMGRSTPD